jgi:hypothetical protein
MEEIIQLKVSLLNSNPSIWREVQVNRDTTFFELHHIIQITMGWLNYHLYEFNLEGYRISEVSEDFRFAGFGSNEVINSRDIKLKDVITAQGDKINYEYDFGDGWQHQIIVESFVKCDRGEYPVCIGGEMRCPPEDCGGIFSFYEYLAILNNKKHPEHNDMVRWFPKKYDPAIFDIEKANKQLQKLDKYIAKWLK